MVAVAAVRWFALLDLRFSLLQAAWTVAHVWQGGSRGVTSRSFNSESDRPGVESRELWVASAKLETSLPLLGMEQSKGTCRNHRG